LGFISLAGAIAYHLSFFPIFSSMSSIISFVVGRVHESGKEMREIMKKNKEMLIYNNTCGIHLVFMDYIPKNILY
jgi:hypothetical protein